MADDAKNGQMNFSTDLSALNQFMKSLQKFVNQANSTEPAVQRLKSLFEELNTMILTLNTSFQAMKDSANVITGFDSLVSTINSLRDSFSALSGGTRGLTTFVNNIHKMSDAVQNLSSLSSQFSTMRDSISSIPNSNIKKVLEYFDRLQTLLNNIVNNFKSLIAVANEIDQLNTLLNQLIETFTRLNSVSQHFGELIQNTKTPTSIQRSEKYFREMIVLVERLNVMYQGLANATGGLGALAEAVSTLDTVMKNLVSVTEQFNTLITQSGTTTPTMGVSKYFEGLLTTVHQVDTSFKTILGDAQNLTQISELFNTMQSSMNSLVNIANQFDAVIQRTAEAPNTSNMEQYFVRMSELIARLNVEFQNFAGVNANIKDVLTTFRELNKVVTQIGKITTKLGSPEDLQKMEEGFSRLLALIKNLVAEINNLDLSSQNFTVLNNTLKNLSQSLKTVSNSSTSATRSVGSVTGGVKTFGTTVKSTGSILGDFWGVFSSTFGPKSLNVLSKLHQGINNLRFGIQGLIMALGGKELWDWLIGTNQQIEALQTSLEVTLKSAQAAEDAIRILRSYAALTPFQELETFQAGEMLAANRMDIDKWIRIAGDLASAKRTAGVELNDVINVLTRINAGDFGKAMIRLRQMGISLNDLREKGLAFTKNNTFKGSTDEMLSALEQIIEERYGGLTESLGQTTEGLISTIKDFFLQLGIHMGDEQFGKLRDWLKIVKADLQDFRDSMEFKKLVQGFNQFMNGMIQYLKPFINTIKDIVMFLLNNLPLIGKILRTVISLSLIKQGLTLFQNLTMSIASSADKWKMINLEATSQVALLRKQGILLTEQQIQLAKINALRRSGNQIMTEGIAKELLQNELAAVGGVTSTSASRLAATAGSISAGVGAVTPKVIAVAMGLQIIGSAITALSTLWKDHSKQLDTTVKDYDRMIGEQVEELRAIERLNSARISANETIKYYSDLQERARMATEDSTFTIEQQADVTNRLADAQNQLIRINEQLLQISPDLVSSITDETGRLTDQTGAFDLNTQAILKNLEARRKALDDMHRDQVEAAKAENEILRLQMKDDERTLRLANDRSAFHVGTAWAATILSGITSIVGIDPRQWISDADRKGLELTIASESDRKQFAQQSKLKNIERQRQIQENEKIIKEAEEAESLGFMDDKGVIDWAGFREYKKRQQDSLNALAKRLAATPQTFIDEVNAANEELDRISRKFDIQLQEELIRNGNNTEGETYKKIEQEKVAAIQAVIDQSISDIQDIYNTARAGWETQIGRVSGALKDLLDAGVEPEEIISALEQGNEAIQKLFAGRNDIIENLLQLYKDLKAKNLQPRDIRSITNDYQTVMEAEQAYQDALDALRLERVRAAVKAMDKASKARSALQEFNDKWNQEKQQMELRKDITLQRDELAGYGPESAVYEEHRKQQNLNIYNFITKQIAALQQLIKSGAITEAKERYQAQTQLLQLDKERNALLLEIKKTLQGSEFNKPSKVNAITYYDYKARDAQASTIEIGDAKFVMQIQSIQTLDDVNKMMSLIKQYLASFIKQSESSGYTRVQNLT